MFSGKSSIPCGRRGSVVYINSCVQAVMLAIAVELLARHISARMREHLVTDGNSHIFKHLHNFQHCRTLGSHDCLSILRLRFHQFPAQNNRISTH